MSTFPVITDEIVRRLDVAGPRYTSYPTVPEWSEQFDAEDHDRAIAAAAGRPKEPLSVYVHIPFCREMCTYCGCNVVVTQSRPRMDHYLEVLERELALVAGGLGERKTVSRVHLGGGTPTSLDEAQLDRLCRALSDVFTMAPGAEMAVEIDPVVTRPEQLALLAERGFGRLSMGVQDFDAGVQEALNRVQTVEETRAIIDFARSVGYGSVNLDLIYGLPRQTPATWQRTLERVIELGPDRMALFSFAYVPAVKTHQRRLSVADLPSATAKLELFRIAVEIFGAAGYRWIGMDHFALPKDELAVAQEERRLWRDFQGYTIQRATDTVALGVSGISAIGGAYAQNDHRISDYEAAVSEGRLPTERGHVLSEDDFLRRDLITQIMCNFWIDLGPGAEERFARELALLREHEEAGLVVRRGSVLEVTPLGRVFVRNVAMVFDAYLSRGRATGRPTFSRTV